MDAKPKHLSRPNGSRQTLSLHRHLFHHRRRPAAPKQGALWRAAPLLQEKPQAISFDNVDRSCDVYDRPNPSGEREHDATRG